MATQPSTIDQTKYREVEFVGGRILEARELQLFQDLERDVPAKGKYELGSLFDPGATLNVQVMIAATSGGYTATLSPVNTAKPMMVFVRGCFEAFTAPVITFTTQSAGFVNQILLNYVLWVVTPDGAGGTLEDLTLIDTITGEPTAEMGQIQIYVGADDHGAIDNVTMLDRNTVSIPMFSLTWQASGVLLLTASTGFGSQVQAGPLQAGVVKLSTATSQTAIAEDDPSVTNARTPAAGSVTTASVKPVVATGSTVPVPFTNEKGLTDPGVVPTVLTGGTSGGIGSSQLVYETWGSTVNASIAYVWSKLVQAYGVLQGFNSRITALENTVPVNLASHIGKPLGPGVHPASSLTDYIANNCAFKVVDAAGTGGVLGEIDATGNYQLLNPGDQTAMTPTGHAALADFLSLATAVTGLLNATPVTEPTVEEVDVTVLAGINGSMPATMSYFIVTMGTTRIAFGKGRVQGGQTIPVPKTDWNGGAGTWGAATRATASIGAFPNIAPIASAHTGSGAGWSYGATASINSAMLTSVLIATTPTESSPYPVGSAVALDIWVDVNVVAVG